MKAYNLRIIISAFSKDFMKYIISRFNNPSCLFFIFFKSLHPRHSKFSKDVAKGKVVALTREHSVCPLKTHWIVIIFVSLYWIQLRPYHTPVKQLIFQTIKPSGLLQCMKSEIVNRITGLLLQDCRITVGLLMSEQLIVVTDLYQNFHKTF